MLSKIRALKEKKGFTLVELIVVLVILAILAALLVPALTGYIDKANDQKVTATTRSIVMAAQTEVSTAYGSASGAELAGGTDVDVLTKAAAKTDSIQPAEIGALAEVLTKTGEGDAATYSKKDTTISEAKVSWDKNGHVTKVVVTQSGRTCTYTEATSSYSVTKATSK